VSSEIDEELRLRIEAAELRLSAAEARQARIERMLLDHEGEHRTTNKLLTALSGHVESLNGRVASLVEAVLQIAAPKKPQP
jgi:hypothetical protein